jgi:hypothetical protein
MMRGNTLRSTIILMPLALTACSPFVDRMKMSEVAPSELQASLAVQVVDQTLPQPTNIGRYIGPVEAWSCKHLMTSKPATKSDAIEQLRVKALRMGANAVIGVTYDEKGTVALGTNCWPTVHAAGTAVLLK